MASMTIRDLDDGLKRRLRIRAAVHGRSMEEEVRDILRSALSVEAAPRDLFDAIRARIDGMDGGADLPSPLREMAPEAIDLDR